MARGPTPDPAALRRERDAGSWTDYPLLDVTPRESDLWAREWRWSVRPLDGVYAAIFIDAIVVKVRDGQVANRPFYATIGVTLAG